MTKLERRPAKVPAQRLARRALGAAVTIGTGTLIVTLAIDQPISIDISGKVEGRAQVIIGTPQAVEEAVRELPPARLAQRVAFPGAEGYGAQATWGLRWRTTNIHGASFLPLVAAVAIPNDSVCDRSNANIHFVTNTNNSGSGSLRQAISASANDTLDIVIFRTGGTVTLTSRLSVNKSCIYFAGQTAPGGGFQLKNAVEQPFFLEASGNGDHIIARYFRIRPGDQSGGGTTINALLSNNRKSTIIDHMSLAWGNDQVVGYGVSADQPPSIDHTIQWTIIAAGLRPKSTGIVWTRTADVDSTMNRISDHHNFYVHNARRNPWVDSPDTIEVVNDVAYNWQTQLGLTRDRFQNHMVIDYINNYSKAGPWTPNPPANIAEKGIEHFINADSPYDPDSVYIAGNYVSNNQAAPQNELIQYTGSKSGVLDDSVFADAAQASPTVPITVLTSSQTRDSILYNSGTASRAGVGAYRGLDCDGTWLWKMDSTDSLFIQAAIDSTAPVADPDDADHEDDYGGFPTLAAGVACTDTDSDGLPDTYETAQCGTTTCMDPRADDDGDGHINLEEYLNGTGP
jgi:hypothetical protein